MGKNSTLSTLFLAPKGFFISIRHNEVRDITAELLEEVCKEVNKEPDLAELTGETFNLKSANTKEEASLDVSARGFGG